MKKTLFKPLALMALGGMLFASCKKDLNNSINPAGGSDESITGQINARVSLNGDYSSIHYNLLRGYLEFNSKSDFNAAMESLTAEMTSLKKDKGETDYLLGLIAGNTNGVTVKNKMIDYSPLSDAVLVAYINKGYPPAFVRDVLFENILFSEEVEAAYNDSDLPPGIKYQIDQKRRQNLSYNDPVLTAFEKRFLGFTSLRKKSHDAESAFLANGGDPEDVGNPGNQNLADEVMATLVNGYGEVKIGNDVYIMLEDKDVKVDADKILILNYIRQNGDIPRHASPVNEPANGLPKLLNPAPVDPSITVEPNGLYNLNCGGVTIEQGAPGTQRVMVSSKSDYDPNAQYYWDFGDGFVSYKSAAEHVYTDGLPSHVITVTVYNSQGVGCNPNESGSSVFHTQGANLSVQSFNGLIVNFQATTTVAGPNDFEWTFGDGTTQTTPNGNVAHIYPDGGNYNVTVNIVHPDGTVDVASVSITVSGSGGGGGNTNECDHSDRAKNKWLTTDNTHKFQHRLRLKNFLLTSAKLNASVNTYRKLANGIWIASSTTNSSANLVGQVFEKTPTDDCGTAVDVNVSSPGGETAFRDATYIFYNAFGFVSVKHESISSQANAFGGSTAIAIKD